MAIDVVAPPELAPGTLRVIPLGGVGDMTVYELDGKLLIVDVGVLFPEENHPGVDSPTATRTTSEPCPTC